LYLTKLEIFGFKSFPEKTTIEFAQGVSAIVGPNGCGKSNIVDALRWVLGEQGDRILRSEKRDDIVFNGTKTRKPLGVAEVSLTIINNKGILQTDYSEVKIARRFFKSGDTEYFLNGTKVRLKDLKNLFVDTGIGPDAYSVIELKMVETILSSVKNERRKMFEEAAGIVSYKQNRDLTFKRLESVRESLNRVNDIIREKQRNINTLERQVKKNEEAKKVFEELKALEIAISIEEYNQMLNEIREIKEHESENISLKENLQKEIEEYDNKLDELIETAAEKDKLFKNVSESVSGKRKEIDKFERENLVNEQKIKSLDENIKRLKSENESLLTGLEKNKDRLEELHNNIEILKNTIFVSEKSLDEKRTVLDNTKKVLREKKDEILLLGKKIKDVNKLVTDKRSNFAKTKNRHDSNLERLNFLSSENQSKLSDVKNLDSEKINSEKELNELKQNLKILEKSYDEKLRNKNSLEKNIADAEKNIQSERLNLQKQLSKISYLENLIDSFEDYAEGVSHLIKSESTAGISTVIDTIEVEDKFKAAIETALGEVSNYIILNDSTRLHKLIKSLEENDKGKVTFILQDKLFSGMNQYIEFENDNLDFLKEKGVYGFADSFARSTNAEYSLLIKYLLDEYVIVENIDIAFKLSRDNYYKFITLDGDIVTDGVVRAGSNIKEDNIKIGRKQRIEKLRLTAKNEEDKISELEAYAEKLKADCESIDLDSDIKSISELEKLINRKSQDISILDFKINSINNSIQENEEEYGKIISENEELTKQINSAMENINLEENSLANLEKELTFLSDEFEEVDKQHNEAQTDFNTFNMEVTKLRSELKTDESNYSRISGTIEYQNKQIEKNKAEIERDLKQYEECRSKIEYNLSRLDEIRAEQSSYLETFNILKSEIDSLRDIQNKINQEQRQRRSTFDKVSQKLIDSQIKIRENTIKSEQIHEYIQKKYEYTISEEDKTDLNNPILQEFIDSDSTLNLYRAKKSADIIGEKLKKLGGGYQQLVWDSFQEEKDELQRIIDQKQDIVESEKDIKKTIEKLDTEARERFVKTFNQIRENFINVFKELFSEGDEANLRLVYEEDENGKINEDPLEAKIEITAKPRGKRPTSIELLSAGEKTLTAIALLFAIYQVKPSPFCVLDEVDAPLDPANLGRFNKMIRKFSDNTQFILITHNERTMESVDRLYGVTMQEPGVTTIVETKFKKDEVEKAEA
jgi:chromosome segregation protein